MAGQAATAAWILRPVAGSDGGDPCTSCLIYVLYSDSGENLAKAGGDGAVMRRFLLEGIAKQKFKTTICYFRGKP